MIYLKEWFIGLAGCGKDKECCNRVWRSLKGCGGLVACDRDKEDCDRGGLTSEEVWRLGRV